MSKLEEIVKRKRSLEQSPSARAQYRLYEERALREYQEKGYFIAGPLGKDELAYPFSLSLHPQPSHDHDLPHCHSYFELAYVAKGTCHNVFPDYEIILHQGQTLLMNPQVVHSLYTLSEEDVVFNFLIAPEFFQHTFLSRTSENVISSFALDSFYQLDSSSDYLIGAASQDPSVDDPLCELLDRLIVEYDSRLPGYESILELGLAQALAYLARNCIGQVSPTLSLPRSQKLGKVLLYILKKAPTVTLKEVASHFHYHEKYVSRLIREEWGMTFTDLVRMARLKQAAFLLVQTTMSVQKIAHTVGYQNQSHFYSIFGERFFMTPAEYRARFAGKEHSQPPV